MPCPYDIAFTVSGKPTRMFCGKWSCPVCAKMNARQWSWRVRLHIHSSGRSWWFITFTLRGSVTTVAQGYKLLPGLWDRMRKALQRFYKAEKWEYCAFVEGQPKRFGMPHFHIISSQPTPTRVKDYAMMHGFGYEASQSPITGDRAASYCAKYASKIDKRMPKNLRRVRVSRGWTRLPDRNMQAYIVRSRKEKLDEYVNRVSEVTGIPQEKITDIYLREISKLRTVVIDKGEKDNILHSVKYR